MTSQVGAIHESPLLLLKENLMKQKHTTGIFPGTFDPLTYGHMDLIQRALVIFDEVIVAVAEDSSEKKPLFSVAERLGLINRAMRGVEGVSVESFRGLVVDYARKKGVNAMIRGIRMLSDFEYEFQMALTNRKLAGDIETIFLMPHESYAYLSSRLIKEVASLNGDISSFAPDFVVQALQKKFKK
jgi:pantetheine-phosphate adenylyltransferase